MQCEYAPPRSKIEEARITWFTAPSYLDRHRNSRYPLRKMKPDRELLKGSTPTLILAVLSDAPRHGYAIAREIERRSGKTLTVGEGSLYPALHALERDGLIAGSWMQPPDGGASKKVYSLTESGTEELARRAREFRGFVSAVEDVLGGVIGGGGKPDVQPA